MSITQRIEEITPEIAKTYLEKNRSNRPIRKGHVRMFATMMEDGDFATTHQGIAISDQDVLLDGQHRLLAIVASGRTVKMSVTEGLPDESFKDMDCGVNRSLSDRVSFDTSHEKNSKIAGVCSALLTMITLGKGNKSLNRAHTSEAVMRAYDQFKGSIDVIVRELYFEIPVEQKQTFVRNRNIQALLVLYHSKYPEKARDVAYRLFNGIGEATDPVRMTYNFLAAHPNIGNVEMLYRVNWAINKANAGATAKHSGKASSVYFLRESVNATDAGNLKVSDVSCILSESEMAAAIGTVA